MARGRMISKSLSTSACYASLNTLAGRLAEFCQALYPLLVAHADDWGCLQGDALTVKHLVHPASPRRLVDFEAALVALHNAHLITWYEQAGKWWVHIRSFAAHQNLHGNDSRKRPTPPPPENPPDFTVPAQPSSNPLSSTQIRPKRTELNLTEPIQSPKNPGTAEVDPDLADDTVTNQDIAGFLKRFCDLYSKHRHGAKYVVRREQDVPNVRRLLRVFDAQRLEQLTVILFTTDDEWITGTDRGIGILVTKVSWLDGLLAEHEATHGRVRVTS